MLVVEEGMFIFRCCCCWVTPGDADAVEQPPRQETAAAALSDNRASQRASQFAFDVARIQVYAKELRARASSSIVLSLSFSLLLPVNVEQQHDEDGIKPTTTDTGNCCGSFSF